MKQKRNAYLVSQSMKVYLAAAIVSVLIQNLNTIIDGVLMGRFLGSEAFSSVNLCLPAVMAVTSIAMLFYSGASIMASVALGAREQKKADDIFTVVVSSAFAAGIILGAAALFGIKGVTNAICQSEELKGYVKTYLTVYFAGCPITLLVMAMLSFTDVGGKPKLVMIASFTNIALNLLGDVVYVYVLGLGIGGAALATLTGSFCSLVIVLVDGKLHGSTFHLVKPDNYFATLKQNLSKGLPMLTQTLSLVIYSYACTFFAQYFCGTNGAFVVSMITQCTSLAQGVSNGISLSFTAIGGMLTGQKDRRGVQFLFQQGFRVSVLFSVLFVVVLMIFAPVMARIMGAESEELVAYSARALRMALAFVVPIGMVWMVPSVYALSGQFAILPLINFSQPVFTALALWGCGALIAPEWMWLGFPVSAVISLLLTYVLSERARKKSKEKLAFFSLLPYAEESGNVYDISVACSDEALAETLKESNAFFDAQNIDRRVSMRVRLCTEEMLLNIIQHANRKTSQYLDLKIVVDDDNIFAVIKDDGAPFDPVHAEIKGAGLKIINGLCPDIDYKYSYGLNMTFMNWKKTV